MICLSCQGVALRLVLLCSFASMMMWTVLCVRRRGGMGWRPGPGPSTSTNTGSTVFTFVGVMGVYTHGTCSMSRVGATVGVTSVMWGGGQWTCTWSMTFSMIIMTSMMRMRMRRSRRRYLYPSNVIVVVYRVERMTGIMDDWLAMLNTFTVVPGRMIVHHTRRLIVQVTLLRR